MTRSILTALAVLFAMPAFAQDSTCGEHGVVTKRLADRYSETRQAIALAGENQIVEIFANLDTGTWTVLVTSPDGPTCLVAAGESYQPLSEPLGPAGEAM